MYFLLPFNKYREYYKSLLVLLSIYMNITKLSTFSLFYLCHCYVRIRYKILSSLSLCWLSLPWLFQLFCRNDRCHCYGTRPLQSRRRYDSDLWSVILTVSVPLFMANVVLIIIIICHSYCYHDYHPHNYFHLSVSYVSWKCINK